MSATLFFFTSGSGTNILKSYFLGTSVRVVVPRSHTRSHILTRYNFVANLCLIVLKTHNVAPPSE